ncbi:MAG: 5-histidylcysteine sulfoxide synthase, partial [Bacteroidetes bacterium]|nr:5-histidylcysteine sulfoxide synthase [Bacteroidota bacterium]
RNPLIFYLGHTAAFYINKLRLAGLIDKGVHENWDHLFAVGVDPNLPENLEVSSYWPTVNEVREYRKTIYQIVHKVIDEADLKNLPITQEHPLWALLMGMEHDRIHFETSSVLIRQLDANLVEKPEGWEYAPSSGSAPETKWISMAGGTITFGKPDDSDIYGWDNEFGTLTVEVKPFKATQNLITNAEFAEFVKAGGYKKEELWSSEGWDWLTRTETSHPKFWVPQGEGFVYRAMFDEMNMPLNWPVEINAHEAQAYCNWKNDGSRLLSEAEFLIIAREGTQESDDPLFTNDHNLDYAYGSPTPVGFMKKGQTASGFNDIYGNVWDWLNDDFYSLSGFKIHPWYADFSAPYMDEDHGMMAGGAWTTTGTGASKYYRLWFRRHFFQHAGFRLAL